MEPARAGARRPPHLRRHERRLPPRGHPPRDWIDALLDEQDEFRVAELQLRADEPAAKAGALADLLGLEVLDDAVRVGRAVVRFLPGGPEGRPELYAERFA
ncbi:MAG: hypothetical protein H0X39_07815 [Actinobacteria bacterium]|nr:hypothetical protein [Actinomycetota bacterium]